MIRPPHWIPITPQEVHSKREWEMLIVVQSGKLFPDLWCKPIAPARKRWRRIRRLLINLEKRE